MKLLKRGYKNILDDPSIIYDKKKHNIKLHFDMHHGFGVLDKAIDIIDEAGAKQRLLPNSRKRKIIGVHEIEEIVAYGAQLAIEDAIENGLSIDLVDLVNQHIEWQDILT